jgi:hypothetical protein
MNQNEDGGVPVAFHCRHATTGILTKDRHENYNSVRFAAVFMFRWSWFATGTTLPSSLEPRLERPLPFPPPGSEVLRQNARRAFARTI